MNAIILWLFIWKFSYMIFFTSKAILNPSSIIYYTGGTYGATFGVFGAIIYIYMQNRKAMFPLKILIDTIFIGVITFSIVYLLLCIVVDKDALSNTLIVLVLYSAYIFYSKFSPLMKPYQTKLYSTSERMEFVKKALVLLLFVGLIGYTLYTTVFMDKNVAVGIEKGNLAPDFELLLLNGESKKLSDFQGQKVMLNFWASWCGPCRAEMPEMQQLHEEYKEKGISIVAVNAFHTETSTAAPEEFINELGLSFPVLVDEKGEVSETYQVIALPTTYFIDSEGKIQDKFTGTLNYEQMLNGLSKLD